VGEPRTTGEIFIIIWIANDLFYAYIGENVDAPGGERPAKPVKTKGGKP